MNKTTNYMLWVVLSTPIWLLMYNILVPNVITNTDTIYIENDVDCAECIEICNGGAYEETMSMEIIIPITNDTEPTMSETERMKTEHPELWQDMAPKYFDDVVHSEEATLFSDAFRKARAELGPGHTFEWNGSMYTTDYI